MVFLKELQVLQKDYKFVQWLEELKSISQWLKKREKSIVKIVLLVKTKLISKALIDSYISHDEFVLINNKPKEYDMKDEIEDFSLFIK